MSVNVSPLEAGDLAPNNDEQDALLPPFHRSVSSVSGPPSWRRRMASALRGTASRALSFGRTRGDSKARHLLSEDAVYLNVHCLTDITANH
jgi:hypothetical protein